MDDWVFDLEGEKPQKPELAYDDKLVPLLSNPKVWEQFQNPVVYEIDCLIRKWIELCSHNVKWARAAKYRKYTIGMVVEQIYGRKWDQSKDGSRTYLYSRIIAYYSSRIQKEAYIAGKRVKKTVYTISPARLSKPPYSLRLRLEWLAERGEVPNAWNMKLPEDDLKKGHARNPKTDANMERRRREAKDKYNERYNRKRKEDGEQ